MTKEEKELQLKVNEFRKKEVALRDECRPYQIKLNQLHNKEHAESLKQYVGKFISKESNWREGYELYYVLEVLSPGDSSSELKVLEFGAVSKNDEPGFGVVLSELYITRHDLFHIIPEDVACTAIGELLYNMIGRMPHSLKSMVMEEKINWKPLDGGI